MAHQDILLTRLRATLDRPDTVLLTGSGTSVWSGLPTWPQLIAKLADFVEALGLNANPVREELATGDLLLAASYGVHQLSLRDFGRFIRSAVDYPHATPARIHQLIATLGPSCFITTNYDQLLESALRQFSPHGAPTVVRNRQPAEIADILPSYARNFVFKYHGDVDDAASVVLTRDDYRRIQHENPAANRAFATLLATRPIVMIGFGLKDLDFLAIKDDLVSAFEGQVGEYFALMPDFDDLRAQYWRQTYQVEVIPYSTHNLPDGRRDHGELLKLLEHLQPRSYTPQAAPLTSSPPPPASQVLLLARLAASITRQKPNPPTQLLPLTVTSEPNAKGEYPLHPRTINDLLRLFEHSLVLLGSPGAGKSFALLSYASELANVLLEHCMQEGAVVGDLHVPVFVNLALYAGDLRRLLQHTLPTGLDLVSILAHRRSTIIMDAANEVPREFIEGGQLITDIHNLVLEHRNCRFMIGSRNESWLSSIDLQRFVISDIDSQYVIDHFSARWSVDISKNPALVTTLSKPLFLSLVDDKRIDLNEIATPWDVYRAFFNHVDRQWREGGYPHIDFAGALESIAFGMLEIGAEFALKTRFVHALSQQGLDTETIELCISYLLAEGVLVALVGHRLSLFHQSVTEYLAARVIARQFSTDKKSLLKRLEDKRWDQALFLSTNFLDVTNREVFIDTIIETDLIAAIRAAHYLDHDQDRVINTILTKLFSSRSDQDGIFMLARHFTQLPFNREHAASLKRLSRRRNIIGGAAAGALFKLEAGDHRELIDLVLRKGYDWNYVQEFVSISQTYWSIGDLHYLFTKLRQSKKNREGLKNFGELFVARVPSDELLSWTRATIHEDSAAKFVLIDGLSETNTKEARALLFNLVRSGEHQAIYPLYSNLKWRSDNMSIGEIHPDIEVVRKVMDGLNVEEGEWALELAKLLIEKESAWKDAFRSFHAGDKDTALLLNIILSDASSINQYISYAISHICDLKNHSLRIVGHLDFWESAPTQTVLAALETRSAYLAGPILEQLQGTELPLLTIKPLDWWLDWALEGLESRGSRAKFWSGYMISRSIAHGDKTTRGEALARFNSDNAADFQRIGRIVYWHGVGDVSTSDLSHISLNRLLDDGGKYSFAGKVLGEAATEDFARNVLIPRLVADPNQKWIRDALKIAGRRHNRRYILKNV